jgi:predicted RNA-binding protein with PIN domain
MPAFAGEDGTMEAQWLIIDGNNLIHSHPGPCPDGPQADFETARWVLAQQIDSLCGALADRVTLVFDGTRGGPHEAFRGRIEVVFSPPELEADGVIERHICSAPNPSGILVVTSDRLLRQTVFGAGAHTMSCAEFSGLLRDKARLTTARCSPSPRRAAGPRLGDFFPAD